jgi:two-component system KDP operon response regulator KdpE
MNQHTEINTESRRILIVDDEEIMALSLQHSMAGLPNCEIAIATDGEQALQLFERHPFDLLITDYQMPGTDGMALATRVRQLYPQTVIFMITASDSNALRERAARASIQHVFDKPVGGEEIRSIALETLRQPRSCWEGNGGSATPEIGAAAAETILVIDDDENLLRIIELTLTGRGFSVSTAARGQEGLALFHQVAPDLVILDIMMPGMDGWEVCRRLRQTSSVPIIFLTALSSVDDVVSGLINGADDYLAKPFEVPELAARVIALLRRARMTSERPAILRFGGGELIINRTEQVVFTQGQEVLLSPIEYNLLLFMAERAGRILPVRLLFDAVWGPCAETGRQSVKWYVWRLRQKIEPIPNKPRFILTERGKGYRFSPQ